MHQQRPPRFTHSYLDSCAFDPGGAEEKCSERLLKRARSGEIHLEIAHSLTKEIDHPNTPSEVKALARQLVYSRPTNLSAEQARERDEIRALIRGNAKAGKHDSDADHLFDLAKHGGGYFITTDPRLLARSQVLFTRYFVTTLKPSEYEGLLQGVA